MNLPRQCTLLAAGLAGGAAALGNPPDSWVDYWHLTDSITAGWVQNISHTTDGPSRSNAMTYGFSLDASHPQQVAHDWLLQLGAGADLLAVPEFDRNSAVSAGPRLGLQRKFGLGPLAPVVRLDAAYRYKSARLPGDSGGTAEAGLRLIKRVNSSLMVAANAQWLEHFASHATFEITQRTLSLEAAWDINERWRLSGSAGRLTGGIVGHAEGEDWAAALAGSLGPVVANYYRSIPREVTDSYGPQWVSYRVDAHADVGVLALACAASDRTTVELRTSHVFVVYKVGLRYPTDSWGLNLIHRF